MTWLVLLALQAPALEEIRSAEVDGADTRLLRVSPGGKYLALGRSGTVEVYTTNDLKRVVNLRSPWTTAGFDEKEAYLIIVGAQIIRWQMADKGEFPFFTLEDASFREPKFQGDPGRTLLPRQAWLSPDGSILYPSRKGGLRKATWDGDKFVSEVLLKSNGNSEFPIRGIIGVSPQTPFLELDHRTGVVTGTTWNYLVSSEDAILAEVFGDVAVLVGSRWEALYSSKTWKLQDRRAVPILGVDEHHAAVLDRKSGFIFVADDSGLRTWSPSSFDKDQRCPEFKGPVRQVAVDSANRLLYTLDIGNLRCWRIKD